MTRILAASLLAAALLPRAGDDGLDRRRDQAASAVESIRGARFGDPVPARAGDRREYGALALENARLLYGQDLSAAGRALRSLGLIGPAVRLDLAIPLLAGAGRVQAFYRKGELVFVDPETPEDELVYKMTLALSDRRHPYRESAVRIGTDFDAQMALAAVHHGDADMTKRLFWSGRKRSEPHPEGHLERLRDEASAWERKDSKWAGAVAPRLFVRCGDLVWRRGGIFMETRRSQGGIEAVDRVYDAPPPSTEQILHPEKYGKEEPAAVDLDPLDKALEGTPWRRLYRTRLGEFGAAVFLETHLADETGAASAGWAGDRLDSFGDGEDRTFSVWATRWDTGADAREFQEAALKASARLRPEEGEISNLVVRRGLSVAFLFAVPDGLREAVLEALWECPVTHGKATRPFGRE